MALRDAVEAGLQDAGVGRIKRFDPVHGGDTHAAWRARSEHGDVFVKTASDASRDAFEAEADALRELSAAIRVPQVVSVGSGEGNAWLALEWLDLAAPTAASDADLGSRLADVHRITRDAHGWHRDNTIGATAQPNPDHADWVRFFTEHRLGFQLKLAAERGYADTLRRRGERLKASLARLFDGYAPVPSLLHGDLWSGNRASLAGQGVLFDPATYYGDRESDLAMTRLFGTFDPRFYRAYESAWPLEPGWERRLRLYQLYHVLNHLNLFGRAYLGQAVSLIDELLA